MNQKLATWRWIWSQRAWLAAADIIQVHDVAWWLYPFFPWIRQKIVITFHGWEGVYPVPWQNQLQRWIASRLVAATIHVGDWIQEFYWDRPTAVIYGGVAARQKVTPKSPRFGKVLKLVFLGRLEAENDLEQYFEMLDRLRHEGVTFTITWVGDGSLAQRCRVYGEVTGMLTNPSQLLKAADVVLASSYLSILEAQAQAKIVISLYSQPLKQRYIKSYPGSDWLIATNDPIVAVHQIHWLMQQPNRVQELARKAARFAKTQTWEKVTATYQNVWHASIN